jgi:hypothetical protein
MIRKRYKFSGVTIPAQVLGIVKGSASDASDSKQHHNFKQIE